MTGLAAAVLAAAVAAGGETFTFGAFGTVRLFAPAGAPREVVLFLSGDGGWNLGVVPMAEALRDRGALVAGIDIRSFLAGLQRGGPRCAYPAGDLEELSRALQLHHRLPAYRAPVLVGYSSGATLAYAVLAQAPAESFLGGISLGFCPDLEMGTPLCRGRALVSQRRAHGIGYDLEPDASMTAPWIALQGEQDQVCAPEATRRFVAGVRSGRVIALPRVGHGFGVTRNWQPQFLAAFDSVTAARREPPPPSAPEVRDLPLVEVPASGGASRDLLAVIATGDGGWAEIDKGVAAGLAARGVPVVGWSSLSYYWTPRTPEGAAQDLERVLRHYLTAWEKSRAVLVGYSFGADVLPFLVNRLSPAMRARVAGIALLGLSPNASFEFHVVGWLGRTVGPEHPTVAEASRLEGIRLTCVLGADERDSACRALPAGKARLVTLPGGHHFGGDYGRLAEVILEGVP